MNKLRKLYIALFFAVGLASAMAQSTTEPVERKSYAWELGIGGALTNWDRVSITDFQNKPDGYLYRLRVQHLLGGANLYLARELNRWFYLDLQGTAGFAGKEIEPAHAGRQNVFLLGGLGLQWRVSPLVDSKYVEPYLRVGANVLHKNFVSKGSGTFFNDPSSTAGWVMDDTWNTKGYMNDKSTYFPFSMGAGVNLWLYNSLGLGLQGEYLTSFHRQAPSFAQLALRVIWRFGGEDKFKPQILYVEKPVERIVERIIEKEVYVPVKDTLTTPTLIPVDDVKPEKEAEKESRAVARSLYDLIDNLYFEFDKDVLTQASMKTLEKLAEVLKQRSDEHFLITGYTDALGSSAYNLELSRRRAKMVFDQLLQMGVPTGMLKWRGAGKHAAAMPVTESNSIRLGDRKTTIERISNQAYWDKLP